MKIIVAGDKIDGYIDKFNYNHCSYGDILIFFVRQTQENKHWNELSMQSIENGKFTTDIIVRDLDISTNEFINKYKKFVVDTYNAEIESNYDYIIDVHYSKIRFNILEDVQQLLSMASDFNDGDRLRCIGKYLFKI